MIGFEPENKGSEAVETQPVRIITDKINVPVFNILNPIDRLIRILSLTRLYVKKT